ncbi:MAG: glycosyltransferase family 2 protein [Clostridia bacterium]|nr:glycosyltransferase family 2 protein [Clostridia bacterium]
MISVIVPVYNTKQYLRKCVASLLDGTTACCEILLIDDGSTDQETVALCDLLASERPDVIRVIHQQNKGLGGARNTGIQEAQGAYLFFVDSDDTVVPGALNRLDDFTRRYPNVDIFSFGFLLEDEKGIHPYEKERDFTAEEPFTLAQRPEYMLLIPSACCRIWRRTLFTEHQIWFPERVWYEDIRTVTKLFPLAKEILWIPEALYVYYQRTGSIMNSANLDRNREIIDAFDDLLGWYRKQGLFAVYEKTLERLCVEHLYLAASVRVLRGDVKHPLLKAFAGYMQAQFPDYRKADYSDLPKARKLVYRLLGGGHYRVIAWLFKMRDGA